MLDAKNERESKLMRDFLKRVWRASYMFSLRRPGLTVQDIIFVLEQWIEVLKTESTRISAKQRLEKMNSGN